MKTMMLVGAAIAAMAMIGVVPASAETTKQNDEVLRLQKVREGNVEVALPTVRKPDGTICTSYVARVSKGQDGAITVTITEICGAATVWKSPLGAQEIRPANLAMMQTHVMDGMTIQAPVIVQDKSTTGTEDAKFKEAADHVLKDLREKSERVEM